MKGSDQQWTLAPASFEASRLMSKRGDGKDRAKGLTTAIVQTNNPLEAR
jgi:hypothetical protein